MKKSKEMVGKVKMRIVSLFLVFGVLSFVFYSDYMTAYASVLPLPWDVTLPSFMENIVTSSTAKNGKETELKKDWETIRELRKMEWKSRYNEALKLAKERYPEDVFTGIDSGFGWGSQDYETFIEDIATLYAETCDPEIFEEGEAGIFDKQIYIDFWNSIKRAISENETIEKIKEGGKMVGTTFRDFCYQSQVTLIKNVCVTYANLVSGVNSAIRLRLVFLVMDMLI